MGKKITDYMPTLTQETTNAVILYRRCSRKMVRDDCYDPEDGCISCPNLLPRAEFLEAMRLSHMLGKRKLKYKKIKG
jgi:hypothetical protein